MIATIEEMTAMLDDTLALARSGRARRAGARGRSHRARRHRGRGVPRARPRRRDGGERAAQRAGPAQSAAPRGSQPRRQRRQIWRRARGSRSAPPGDRIAIEVTDRGPGIPEAELGNVQEPFVRLEGSRNRETGGSGLGLTLARSAAAGAWRQPRAGEPARRRPAGADPAAGLAGARTVRDQLESAHPFALSLSKGLPSCSYRKK